MLTGTVMRAAGGTYDVATDEGVLVAVMRGRLKSEPRSGERIVVGDLVVLDAPPRPEDPWTIEEVRERKSALVRRAPGKAPRPKVIVANVDQILIVFAAAHPHPNLRMLDRFLVLAESSDLEVTLVVNKTDRSEPAEIESTFGIYREIGYPVLKTSVTESEGIDELREVLCGRVSALSGPSGVGKSSLLNEVQPGLGLRVGAVSEALNKGQHTTVTAQLIELECGGFVADTPGLREVGLWDVDDEILDQCFPEFDPFLGKCRFKSSCSHSHEPGCSVLDAVGTSISQSRYDSYLKLLLGDE